MNKKIKNESFDRTASHMAGEYVSHSEPTDPYEKGFIDGMQKQMQSRVQQMVEGYAQLRELNNKEIEALKEKAEHWEEKYRDAIADLSIENYWKDGK